MIIVDFDGVILESVTVKTDAFRDLFSSEPSHLEEIIEFHIKNGGMSRFDKFRYIYTHILHRELTDAQFRYLSDRFADLVFENVMKTPFVPGAHEFLQANYRRFPIYVVSATPEDELMQIVEERGLGGFFKGVFGAPKKKTDHILQILATTKCRKAGAVFIGDAINDFRAAEAAGIRFIGRVRDGDKDPFTGNLAVEHTIGTFFELDRIIRTENGA